MKVAVTFANFVTSFAKVVVPFAKEMIFFVKVVVEFGKVAACFAKVVILFRTSAEESPKIIITIRADMAADRAKAALLETTVAQFLCDIQAVDAHGIFLRTKRMDYLGLRGSPIASTFQEKGI